MLDPYLGEIAMTAYNFAERNFVFCNGQSLAISQNQALFALLGTTYGGNGQTTFMLPDLRGRVPIAQGVGPSGNTYNIGETGGTATNTLLVSHMPIHTHTLNAVSEEGTSLTSLQGTFIANSGALDPEFKTTGTLVAMHASAVSSVGASTPFNNMKPYLVIQYAIAIAGVFPSRS